MLQSESDHFHFLSFFYFLSICKVLVIHIDTTDEGAIAPKALVILEINAKFYFSKIWWIEEEISRVSNGKIHCFCIMKSAP